MATSYSESFEKKLCDEIDQKLSLISALDMVLNDPTFNFAAFDISNSTSFEAQLSNNETDICVRVCVESIVDKVVDLYDSIYNEMPVIALDKFAEYAINYNNNDTFKMTLSALNLPKCPPKMCSICNKEGHLERECPQDFLLELEVLPETTLNWKEILDKVCRHIMSKKY